MKLVDIFQYLAVGGTVAAQLEMDDALLRSGHPATLTIPCSIAGHVGTLNVTWNPNAATNAAASPASLANVPVPDGPTENSLTEGVDHSGGGPSGPSYPSSSQTTQPPSSAVQAEMARQEAIAEQNAQALNKSGGDGPSGPEGGVNPDDYKPVDVASLNADAVDQLDEQPDPLGRPVDSAFKDNT